MSRWFRHYAGMMRDDKLVRAALKAQQPIERVVWIWGAILESAAEINDGGRYDIDPAEVAYFLRADEADIRAIFTALAGMQRLADDRVVNWSARQFQSDRSAPRQAAYRDRKRQESSKTDDRKTSGDEQVTAASRHGDAPETETETETNTEAEKEKKEPSLRSGTRANKIVSRETSRGTRLADGWRPDLADEQFAVEKLGSLPEAREELAKFHDHWKAQPGQRGVKTNWSSTYRNWCRRAVEMRGRGPPKRQQQPSFQDIADEIRSKFNGPNQAHPTSQPLEGELDLSGVAGMRSRG